MLKSARSELHALQMNCLLGVGEEISHQVLDITSEVLCQTAAPLCELISAAAPESLDHLARLRGIKSSSGLLATIQISEETDTAEKKPPGAHANRSLPSHNGI